MDLDASQCQLVLVDFQSRLMPHIQDAQRVIAQAQLLAQVAQVLHVPIHASEQTALGSTVAQLSPWLGQALQKTHFDACADGLIARLQSAVAPQGNARSLPKSLRAGAQQAVPQRDTVILAGVEAHICVLQTALGLLAQEFDVWVVTDASGACRTRQSDAAWDRLASAGVELVTAEMVVYEWLRDSRHPAFGRVLPWIKAARQVG